MNFAMSIIPFENRVLAPAGSWGAYSLSVVFIVAAPPHTGLVAAEWRAVEPRIHAPNGIHAALVGRVGVVDDTVLLREGAQAGPFFAVGRPVRSDAGRDRSDEGILVGLLQPEVDGAEVVLDGSSLPFLICMGHVEVVVEVAISRGRPGKAPAHPLLVGLQFRQRRA